MNGKVENPTENHGSEPSDGLIADVRRIRRNVCEAWGHDLDRLCDHLEAVGRQYDAREGVFAVVAVDAAARVVAGWGEDAHRRDEPIVDEVRAIRRRRARD
jgi:hypothetical protein